MTDTYAFGNGNRERLLPPIASAALHRSPKESGNTGLAQPDTAGTCGTARTAKERPAKFLPAVYERDRVRSHDAGRFGPKTAAAERNGPETAVERRADFIGRKIALGPYKDQHLLPGAESLPSGVRFPLSSQWAISRLPAQGSSSSSRKGIGESTRGR